MGYSPGHRERVEHDRPRARARSRASSATGASSRRSATALLRLSLASLTGGIIGAVALLELPEEAFEAIVPVFIVLALVLIVLQPRLAKRLARGAARDPARAGHDRGRVGHRHLRRLLRRRAGDPAARHPRRDAAGGPPDVNAIKNLLAMLVNLVSGIIFAFVAPVAWEAVALVAAGSIVGGALGARYGRRLPPDMLAGHHRRGRSWWRSCACHVESPMRGRGLAIAAPRGRCDQRHGGRGGRRAGHGERQCRGPGNTWSPNNPTVTRRRDR